MKNRLERLIEILKTLNRGEGINTLKTANRFGVSQKTVQTDLKEYLAPMAKNIYYSHSKKTYITNAGFLHETPFSAKELATMSILKNRSKNRYSDGSIEEEADELFEHFKQNLQALIYQKSQVEKITLSSKNQNIIESSIAKNRVLKCSYSSKERVLYPLKILNIEGYWYLVAKLMPDKEVRNFYLNDIKTPKIVEQKFTFDEDRLKNLDNAITAYCEVDKEPFPIQLLVDERIIKYFKRRPLNKTQRVMVDPDGSIILELYITHEMEIIPTIQRYIPYVKVIKPESLSEKIKENIEQMMI